GPGRVDALVLGPRGVDTHGRAVHERTGTRGGGSLEDARRAVHVRLPELALAVRGLDPPREVDDSVGPREKGGEVVARDVCGLPFDLRLRGLRPAAGDPQH